MLNRLGLRKKKPLPLVISCPFNPVTTIDLPDKPFYWHDPATTHTTLVSSTEGTTEGCSSLDVAPNFHGRRRGHILHDEPLPLPPMPSWTLASSPAFAHLRQPTSAPSDRRRGMAGQDSSEMDTSVRPYTPTTASQAQGKQPSTPATSPLDDTPDLHYRDAFEFDEHLTRHPTRRRMGHVRELSAEEHKHYFLPPSHHHLVHHRRSPRARTYDVPDWMSPPPPPPLASTAPRPSPPPKLPTISMLLPGRTLTLHDDPYIHALCTPPLPSEDGQDSLGGDDEADEYEYEYEDEDEDEERVVLAASSQFFEGNTQPLSIPRKTASPLSKPLGPRPMGRGTPGIPATTATIATTATPAVSLRMLQLLGALGPRLQRHGYPAHAPTPFSPEAQQRTAEAEVFDAGNSSEDDDSPHYYDMSWLDEAPEPEPEPEPEAEESEPFEDGTAEDEKPAAMPGLGFVAARDAAWTLARRFLEGELGTGDEVSEDGDMDDDTHPHAHPHEDEDERSGREPQGEAPSSNVWEPEEGSVIRFGASGTSYRRSATADTESESVYSQVTLPRSTSASASAAASTIPHTHTHHTYGRPPGLFERSRMMLRHDLPPLDTHVDSMASTSTILRTPLDGNGDGDGDEYLPRPSGSSAKAQ